MTLITKNSNINQTLLGADYTQVLYMDVYFPENDDFQDRPLIFFMFGGSFVTGSKLSADVVNLCIQYAKRGYVAVAIDYRLSQNLLFFDPNEENAYKAVLKAVHDLKAAIRYFRMMDEISNETFRIDTNRIPPKIFLSPIFDWFADDFKASGGVLKFIKPYVSPKYRHALEDPQYSVSYMDYNWSINGS